MSGGDERLSTFVCPCNMPLPVSPLCRPAVASLRRAVINVAWIKSTHHGFLT